MNAFRNGQSRTIVNDFRICAHALHDGAGATEPRNTGVGDAPANKSRRSHGLSPESGYRLSCGFENPESERVADAALKVRAWIAQAARRCCRRWRGSRAARRLRTMHSVWRAAKSRDWLRRPGIIAGAKWNPERTGFSAARRFGGMLRGVMRRCCRGWCGRASRVGLGCWR